MNTWYYDNKYKLDYIFIQVTQFIHKYNIQLYVDLNKLYTKFIHVGFKGSNKPFTKYNYTYYNIAPRYINNYYNITIGSKFYDLIYNLLLDVQEYDSIFLCRLHPFSLQHFFENMFNLKNIPSSNYIDYEQENDTETYYIDY